jgi:hypothetical protein
MIAIQTFTLLKIRSRILSPGMRFEHVCLSIGCLPIPSPVVLHKLASWRTETRIIIIAEGGFKSRLANGMQRHRRLQRQMLLWRSQGSIASSPCKFAKTEATVTDAL